MKTSLDNKQTDLRVRRTHKLLWEALMGLLCEQTFEEITVKDICERAMVVVLTTRQLTNCKLKRTASSPNLIALSTN